MIFSVIIFKIIIYFTACVPLNSELEDGIVFRNDTMSGIDYRFTCNGGFVINGSSHVTCVDGVYNGSSPNCLPKGEGNTFLPIRQVQRKIVDI